MPRARVEILERAGHPDGQRVKAEEYPLARVFTTGEAAGPDDYLYQRGDGPRSDAALGLGLGVVRRARLRVRTQRWWSRAVSHALAASTTMRARTCSSAPVRLFTKCTPSTARSAPIAFLVLTPPSSHSNVAAVKAAIDTKVDAKHPAVMQTWPRATGLGSLDAEVVADEMAAYLDGQDDLVSDGVLGLMDAIERFDG